MQTSWKHSFIGAALGLVLPAIHAVAAPTLTIPSDLVLDYPAVTTTNATGAATATDGCSRATVTFSDSGTSGCGATRVIARTWTATDECGNSVSQVQNITVRDITPPVIAGPASRTLEHPAKTGPANTGVATALDTCSSVMVTFSDIVTTNCGNTIVITRTWTATDECNNRSSCTQTITVRDTTAPMISCPPSVTLEYPAITTTNATGVATATDAGGAVTITYADTVTANCGDTYTITRRWTATDSCNNSSSCTQTITVRDTTPPVLTGCTNKAVYAGSALVFDTPAASDNSTAIVSVVSTTTNFPNPEVCSITRTWTAMDACGNVAPTQSQMITVLPPLLTRLEIVKLSDSSLLLRWPTNVTGYRLEWSYDLKNWSPVAGTPRVSDAYNRVGVSAIGGKRFFRLKK